MALAAILAAGLALRAFAITPAQIAGIGAAALLAQYLGSLMTATRFDPRSALVTTLSLSLLLRADGMTPLANAVTCEHAEIVAALVKHGADVNAADDDGETPLSSASDDIRRLMT